MLISDFNNTYKQQLWKTYSLIGLHNSVFYFINKGWFPSFYSKSLSVRVICAGTNTRDSVSPVHYPPGSSALAALDSG